MKSNMDAAIDEGSQRGSGHKVIAKKSIKLSIGGVGNLAILRYPFKRTEGSKICPPAKNPKIQKVRLNDGYIQKKFSPSIMTLLSCLLVLKTHFSGLVNLFPIVYLSLLTYFV